MTDFLQNMINRHQGTVDKVQTRVRSMFEPEPASAVIEDNAFANEASTNIKERHDTGFEKQSVISRPLGIEQPIPENLPPAPLALPFHQSVQGRESFGPADPHPLDKNHMDSMNEQIQSVLARLVRKSEPSEPLNGSTGLQKTVLSGATNYTHNKVVSNETGRTNHIDEALRQLKTQTNKGKENQHSFEDLAQLSPVNVSKIETDRSPTLPAQLQTEGERFSESLNKSIKHQNQAADTSVKSQSGSLQIPGWLTSMQTDLNKRWREITAQTHAEPVINVTIGRIEIRATNSQTAKPSSVQKKPTGVMSLDDYLKQRESKWRI